MTAPNVVVQVFTNEHVAYVVVAVRRIVTVVMALVVKMSVALGARGEGKSFTHTKTERR